MLSPTLFFVYPSIPCCPKSARRWAEGEGYPAVRPSVRPSVPVSLRIVDDDGPADYLSIYPFYLLHLAICPSAQPPSAQQPSSIVHRSPVGPASKRAPGGQPMDRWPAIPLFGRTHSHTHPQPGRLN